MFEAQSYGFNNGSFRRILGGVEDVRIADMACSRYGAAKNQSNIIWLRIFSHKQVLPSEDR